MDGDVTNTSLEEAAKLAAKFETGRFEAPASADSIHVVLVETEENRNVGSVARAMMNLGFKHLHLVRPKKYEKRLAMVTACHAFPLLDALTVHDSLESALSPMEEVVGLTARGGKNRSTPLLLPHWAPTWYRAERKTTALVFGPEDTGLRQEHVEHCTWTVRIPATDAYSSFNLSQAVLLTLFELARHEWLGAESPPNADDRGPMPTWNEFYHLDRLVDSTLTNAGFYRKGSPETVPGIVRNLFRRMLPNQREMGILLAIFGRLERTFRFLPEGRTAETEADHS